MGGDLESTRCGVVLERAQLGVGVPRVPARVRLVGIRLLEPRAARTERSVGEEFGADSAQPVAVEPAGRVGHASQRFGAEKVGHEADLQMAAVACAAECFPVVERRAHRADSRDSEAEQDFLRLGQSERLTDAALHHLEAWNEAVCAARARMPIQRTSQQAWCAQLAPTFKSNFQNPRVPPTGGSHLPHAHPGSFEMRRTVPVPTCGAGGGRQSALISPEVAEPVG